MPFQISELVIRVAADSPDGMLAAAPKDPVTACRHGGTTCMPPTPDPVTACRHGGTTCMPPGPPDTVTECRHGGTTCMPKKPAAPKKAELDAVLGQLRAAVAAEAADESVLTLA
jgi:hypothetical protein